MKILTISDEESKYFWDFYKDDMFNEYDLIISCGDLDKDYLTFIATFAHAPVLYVNGNHDGKNENDVPEGCFCIEDTVYNFNGIKILGLGGSMRYNQGKNQYTQKEMDRRLLRLKMKFKLNKGVDILVTHAPAYQINDGKDIAHTGFKAFTKILDQYSPKYFIHGHIHQNYGSGFKRVSKYKDTTIINAYNKHIFEY